MYRDSAAEDRSILVVGLNSRVFGVDPASGRRVWEHLLDSTPAGEVELLVHGGRVFATNGRVLACLEYPSGRLVGTRHLPGTFKGRPTMLLEAGRLFVGTRGELTCYDMDGHELWHDGFPGKGVGSMSLGFPDNVRQADDAGG